MSKCLNPRRLPNPAAVSFEDAFMLVPCGKCIECLKNRRRQWLFRLKNEHLDSVKSVFCTFTYDDDFYDGYVHKEDLQKFFKKLRHYEEFTYYAIGEYGTNTHRGHAHAVIFFKTYPTDCGIDYFHRLAESMWNKGFIAVSKVTYRRLNYVLHYHIRPKIVDGKPTFQLFSKGMGLSFLTQDIADYISSSHKPFIRDFEGKIYVIPRYYRKKLAELGYDSSVDMVYDVDYSKKRVEDAAGCKLYQLSDFEISQILYDILKLSDRKINNYNNQDKLK